MLTTKVVQENITSILDMLKREDLEGAKKLIQTITPSVKSEREKGALLAASGIYASKAKGKEGTFQTWDNARIERAAKSIVASQMSDDFDAGYAESLLSYVRLTQDSQLPAE